MDNPKKLIEEINSAIQDAENFKKDLEIMEALRSAGINMDELISELQGAKKCISDNSKPQ
jgi:hypothetical protein